MVKCKEGKCLREKMKLILQSTSEVRNTKLGIIVFRFPLVGSAGEQSIQINQEEHNALPPPPPGCVIKQQIERVLS